MPPEFIQPDEFRTLTDRANRASWRKWLDRIGVRYVTTPTGYPLVYRDRLQSEGGAADINIGALHRAPRRQTAKA